MNNLLKTKSSYNGGVDGDQIQWPDWLPHDWYIHRKLINSHAQLQYSNPRGERFHSKEEVVQYLAKQAARRVTKRRKRKNKDANNDIEEKTKLEAEIKLQFLANPPQEWPFWLPQDWSIERSLENPNDVCYCNPKRKKFGSKDEVLHYLHTNSKKMSKKPRKKKVPHSKEARYFTNKETKIFKTISDFDKCLRKTERKNEKEKVRKRIMLTEM